MPNVGRYLWEWFQDLSASMTRIKNGVCSLIPPSEFAAWRAMTGNVVYPFEYAILQAMDRAYRDAMNVELSAAEARRREQSEAEAAAKAPKRGRRGK